MPGETCEGCPADCGPCPLSACCTSSGAPGCAEDAVLEACVCGLDGYCCDVAWSATCVTYGILACENPCLPLVCGDGFCAMEEDCATCAGDCGACQSGCADALFFSEYFEGSGQNKGFELHNNTGKPVDLGAYAIWRIANGGEWSEGEAAAWPLSGTLVHGGTLVVCHAEADLEVTAVCDVLINDSPVYFNGDDALGLAKDGALVDVVGTSGADPGVGWDVSGFEAATADHTLVRKPTIGRGNTDWPASAAREWIVHQKNTFWGLGAHIIDSTCTPSE